MLSVFSKKDFINVKWLVAEKLIQVAVGIFIIPKLFNELGTNSIGQLEFSKTLIGILSPLFFLGLSAICIRELVLHPLEKHKILATAFYLRLASCILVFIGLTYYVSIAKTTPIPFILLIIGFGYCIKTTDVLAYYLHAKKWSKILFIARISSLVIISLAQYIGILQHYSVYYFAILIVMDFLLQGIIYSYFLFIKKHLQISKWKFSKQMAFRLLKSSYPLIISNFIILFYIGIDELFIKYYLGDAANGTFATVQFLVITLTWNIGFAIINALYPAFAEAYKNNPNLYIKRLRLTYKTMSIIGIAIGLLFTFFSDLILTTFYTESYFVANIPLKIFGWAPLFIFIGMIYEKHLVNTNQLQKDIYRFTIGCIVNVLLCFYLIPIYKVKGAAIAVLISHFITNIGYLFMDKDGRIHLVNIFKT